MPLQDDPNPSAFEVRTARWDLRMMCATSGDVPDIASLLDIKGVGEWAYFVQGRHRWPTLTADDGAKELKRLIAASGPGFVQPHNLWVARSAGGTLEAFATTELKPAHEDAEVYAVEVSMFVRPYEPRRGYGSDVLKRLVVLYIATHDVALVEAWIHRGNSASVGFFQAHRFRLKETHRPSHDLYQALPHKVLEARPPSLGSSTCERQPAPSPGRNS